MLITSKDHFGGWSNNIESWLTRGGSTVLVKYEELLEEPLEIVSGSLEKVNFPFRRQDQTQSQISFDELHDKMPHFFRRGKAGAWRTEMPDDLQEMFWQFNGSTMRQLGYVP